MENFEKIKQELSDSDAAENCHKDILIVVHDQLNYIKNCIESILDNTKNFTLHVWDNASKPETSNYLSELKNKKIINLYESKNNIGFIVPNNYMASKSSSDYLILLNSDCEVYKNWDTVLIGGLIKNKNIAQIGYLGGKLNKEGKGYKGVYGGFEADYICGWCFCISREIYNKFGLFDDKNLKFAYCEDSDFSLRLRDAGYAVYVCYAGDLVKHYGNKTVFQVLSEKDISKDLKSNQNYIIKKWSKFLE